MRYQRTMIVLAKNDQHCSDKSTSKEKNTLVRYLRTLIVKVLSLYPSLSTHRTLFRPTHEGARPRTSVSSQSCVLRQANIDLLGYPTTRTYTYRSFPYYALISPPGVSYSSPRVLTRYVSRVYPSPA